MNSPLTTPKVALAIVDDEQLVLEGLACLFGNENGFEVVAIGRTWDETCRAARSLPQLALVDVGRLHPRGWGEFTAAPFSLSGVRFVALDDRVRSSSLRQVLRRGWHGYATKADPLKEIRTVVIGAAQGDQAFSPPSRNHLQHTHLGWRVREDDASPGLHLLSPREMEILARLAEGHSSASCAKALQIAPSTVDNHKANIMKKLNVRRVVELVRLAIGEGLVQGGIVDPVNYQARKAPQR